MRWASYRVRLDGNDYPASAEPRPEGLWMRLRRSSPAAGFDRVVDGLYVRAVPAAECTAAMFVTTTGQWRGVQVQVHDERDDQFLVQYLGGSAPEARKLGFERIERGVHRGWVDQEEVRNLREDTTLLTN